MTAANGSALMDWDDVRVFLAVARHGSLRAAGRALGLSQPTVGRRLTSFEATFGGPTLFDRLPEGLRLNAAGEALIAVAEELESAAFALERRRAAASPALSGTVRVSVGEWAANFLARFLAGTSATALPSGITLELVETQQTANLARREADLALRHHPPESGDLYITKAGVFACAVYRRDRAESNAWVTYTEEQAHYPPRAGCRSGCARPATRSRCVPRTWRCNLPRFAPARAVACCRVSLVTPTRCWKG